MKVLTSVLILLLAAVLIVPGCSKKDEPVVPSPPEAKDVEDAAAKMPDTKEVEDVAAKVSEMASGFTMDVDLQKSVDALKAEAAKMSVDKLEAMAKKYKDEIVKKDAELQTLMDKLSAIPMMEKMGSEAQGITKDMKVLGETVKALSDRFQVYFDAAKAKGSSLEGLTM